MVEGKLTVSKVLVGFASSIILFGIGVIVNSTFGDSKDVAALKVKTSIHDKQLNRVEDRLDRIESKADRILGLLERQKE